MYMHARGIDSASVSTVFQYGCFKSFSFRQFFFISVRQII
jgi:hypothetical protein